MSLILYVKFAVLEHEEVYQTKEDEPLQRSLDGENIILKYTKEGDRWF